jgi:hypothetical protein
MPAIRILSCSDVSEGRSENRKDGPNVQDEDAVERLSEARVAIILSNRWREDKDDGPGEE